MPEKIYLANNEILFLDEITEFNKRHLMHLDNVSIFILRVRHTHISLLSFMLISAINQC